MSFKVQGKKLFTNDGLPYMWESSKNINTIPVSSVVLTEASASANDEFGYEVAIGGNTIAVSIFYFDVSGNTDAGAVNLYDLDGNFKTRITDPDGAADDVFGRSIDIGSGIIAIGANGDEVFTGSASLADLDGNIFTKITVSGGQSGDAFGQDLAIGSGVVVIGAPGVSSGQGAVYTYDTSGNFLKKLTDPNGEASDNFGGNVAAGCGRIIVGSQGSSGAGSVFIYDKYGNFIRKITSPNATGGEDDFGNRVSINCGRIVVGAPLEQIGANTQQGAVYIFDIDGNFIKRLYDESGYDSERFGREAAVYAGRIFVGRRSVSTSGGTVEIYDLDGDHITTFTDNDLEGNYGIGIYANEGRLIIGSSEYNSGIGRAFLYSIDHAYTIYDAYDMSRGYK